MQYCTIEQTGYEARRFARVVSTKYGLSVALDRFVRVLSGGTRQLLAHNSFQDQFLGELTYRMMSFVVSVVSGSGKSRKIPCSMSMRETSDMHNKLY